MTEGDQVFPQDLLIKTSWFQSPEPSQLSLCPMMIRLRKTVSVPQAECEDLLFDPLKSQLVIAAHPDIIFDLFILIGRYMNRSVIMMSKAPGQKGRITFVRFNLFPS